MSDKQQSKKPLSKKESGKGEGRGRVPRVA
jgi:hypothetical protein